MNLKFSVSLRRAMLIVRRSVSKYDFVNSDAQSEKYSVMGLFHSHNLNLTVNMKYQLKFI